MKWLIALTLAASFASVSHGAEVPAKASAPAAAAEPTLAGTVIPRADGGFITLTLDGPTMVLRFFDKEKKPVAADVDRAAVRLQFSNRTPERRVLIRSEDGFSLSGGQPLKGPFIFRAYITLLRGSDNDGEKYQINYP